MTTYYAQNYASIICHCLARVLYSSIQNMHHNICNSVDEEANLASCQV